MAHKAHTTAHHALNVVKHLTVIVVYVLIGELVATR